MKRFTKRSQYYADNATAGRSITAGNGRRSYFPHCANTEPVCAPITSGKLYLNVASRHQHARQRGPCK